MLDKNKMDSLVNLVAEKNTLKKLDIEFDEKNLEEILEAVCTN